MDSDTWKVIITVAGTLLASSAAAQIVDWIKTRSVKQLDDGTQIRKELREDRDKAESEKETWQKEYYELLKQHLHITSQHEVDQRLLTECKDSLARLRKKAGIEDE